MDGKEAGSVGSYLDSGFLTFMRHPNLSRFADDLWDVLGLFYRR